MNEQLRVILDKNGLGGAGLAGVALVACAETGLAVTAATVAAFGIFGGADLGGGIDIRSGVLVVVVRSHDASRARCRRSDSSEARLATIDVTALVIALHTVAGARVGIADEGDGVDRVGAGRVERHLNVVDDVVGERLQTGLDGVLRCQVMGVSRISVGSRDGTSGPFFSLGIGEGESPETGGCCCGSVITVSDSDPDDLADFGQAVAVLGGEWIIATRADAGGAVDSSVSWVARA